MPESKSDRQQQRSQLRENLQDRWANEAKADVPPLANAELVQLQVRVIALENLLIALLAQASDRQLTLAREMATYISPRPGYTPHSLTLHAADQMLHLVERGEFFGLSARAGQAGADSAGDK
ncbi:MAG: hypothetical protein Q8O29_04340 [Polaromonas sp.]|uniref:hypothetical protein n=1 Tax=Polaromonas sp. TaxID=1869339 RepID=UPI0027360739|nr:hypothetical protein [Polaromonas sp.]MDP2817502.1 hypothetical protein [Polaromonas sp.]